jgi:hypothetical protein
MNACRQVQRGDALAVLGSPRRPALSTCVVRVQAAASVAISVQAGLLVEGAYEATAAADQPAELWAQKTVSQRTNDREW